VTGWAAPQAAATITSAVHHLRVRGKDHLVYADARARCTTWTGAVRAAARRS
jgi:hypothetical protein